MKKAIPFVLITVTLVFCGFMIGVLVGKQSNTTVITQYVLPSDTSEETNAKTSALSKQININTASKAEFMLLPGIGETLAQRIITYREVNGPFQCVEDLQNVSGIGDGRMAQILEYVTIGGEE